MNGSTTHFRPRHRLVPVTTKSFWYQGYEDAAARQTPAGTPEYLEGYEARLWDEWADVRESWEELARLRGRRS